MVLLSEAELLLGEGDPEDFRTLLKILTQANAEWVTPNRFIPRQRPPTPFHVLLQSRPPSARRPDARSIPSISERLAEAGIEAEPWS